MDNASLTFMGLPLLAWIPLLPLLGAPVNLTIGRRMSKTFVHTVACGSVLTACVLVFYLVFGPLWHAFRAGQGGTGIYQSAYTWIAVGNFHIDLAFRLDTLSAVMVLIITFVGSWIHIYSTGYMAHDPGYARYFGYLNLFTGAMLILVLGSSLLVMFIGWEGVGLCSFLLIGFWYENDAFATAGRKAFVVNRIGDFCFLLGMFLLFWATKSLDFADLKGAVAGSHFISGQWGPHNAHVWGGERLATAAGILLFIGACGKSAQIPLYVWLPDAMAGPTPVSALIHAATMVTAGVYMVCRLSFLYSASTTALIVISTVGMLTALAAAFMAFAQTDMKKVLAYSTVSQLGFMFVAAGTGNWLAAIFHLGAHAFFKACLFLGAGSVMHGMEHGGSKTPGDITTMGGLRKHMPITRWTFWISCMAISGIAPFSGFFSKDEILGGAWDVHAPGWPPGYGKFLWAGLAIAALGTAFYMWRLYFMVFGGEERTEHARHAHESPRSMTSALVVLAALAAIAGLIGFPELTGIHVPGVFHALGSWLAPSVTSTWYNGATASALPIHGEVHNAMTLLLMGIALTLAMVGIAVAWALYGRGPSPYLSRWTSGWLADLYQASKNKLWVDEIYDAVFVRPFRALCRGLAEIVDRFVIDTVAVNGVAFVVGLFSRLSRWVQNGQVQRYIVGVVLGAAGVFLLTSWHRHPTFAYKQADAAHLAFHAEPGAGLAGEGAKVAWHLDGSTDCSQPTGFTGTDITVPAGDVGAQVTLCIEDPITHKTTAVTRTIQLGGTAQ